MRVAVAGGGLAGLMAALCLSRDGADVVLVEPDAPPPAAPPDVLADRTRPGAPQAPHPHIFMPLARRLLATEMPEVYERALDAGAHEVDMRPHLPPGEPDDERERELPALAVRRPACSRATGSCRQSSWWTLRTTRRSRGCRPMRHGWRRRPRAGSPVSGSWGGLSNVLVECGELPVPYVGVPLPGPWAPAPPPLG